VKVPDVTGSTYGLNNVSVENTLINNANAQHLNLPHPQD
jgi:hypothetical protein